MDTTTDECKVGHSDDYELTAFSNNASMKTIECQLHQNPVFKLVSNSTTATATEINITKLVVFGVLFLTALLAIGISVGVTQSRKESNSGLSSASSNNNGLFDTKNAVHF